MKIKVGIAGLLTALALTTGGPGGPPAADAASGVSYCFRYANNIGGAPAVTRRYPNYGEYDSPTLMAYYSDGWRAVVVGTTGLNGCGAFTISTSLQNRYLKVVWVSVAGIPRATYGGESPLIALPGSHTLSLGTGTVYRIR